MSHNQKTSQFNVLQSLDDSASVSLVSNGQNYTITYGDLKASMGTSGEFSSVGNQLAVPVLTNPANNVYGVRSIESSKGLNAQVSAEDGIVLSANFTQTGDGETLVTDLNADTYNFKTLTAGDNIVFSSSDTNITISFSGEETSSSTVAVSSVSDFPEPSGESITLANNTDYLLLNDVETDYNLISNGSNTVRGASSQIVKLTYTGTNALFTGSNSNFLTRGLTFSCPNGSVFDMSNTAISGVLQVIECNVEECETIGTLNNMFITRFSNVGWENIKTNGLSFTGENTNVDLGTGIVFINDGTFLDLGSATFQEISVSKQIFQQGSDSGVTFLKGLADSGNIIAGGIATFTDNRVSVLTTPLDTISTSDSLIDFSNNTGIANSMNDALMYFTGSLIPVVIATASVPVKILNATSWLLSDSSRFEFDNSGRLTYTGERPARLPIDLEATLLMVSGGDKQCGLSIAINGSVLTQTLKQATVSAAKAGSISTIWQHEFVKGDYVEAFVSNESGITSLIVQDAIMRIN